MSIGIALNVPAVTEVWAAH